MGNKFDLDEDMLAFAAFLKRADDFITGDTIEEIRRGTRRLRQETMRSTPPLNTVEDRFFEDLRYRIYRPAGADTPVQAVFLHGGGWSHLDIDVYDPIVRRLALESGLTFAAIDYPLAPEVPFPGNLDACVRFVRQMAGQVGQLALIGDFAGANLAAGVALIMRDGQEDLLSCLGFAYGVFDLAHERPSYALYGNGDLPLTTTGLRKSRLRYMPDIDLRREPLVSPLRADLAGLPPTFLAIASHDPLYDENVEMATSLADAGCDVAATVYAGTIHGFLEAESVVGSRIAGGALADLGKFAKRWQIRA